MAGQTVGGQAGTAQAPRVISSILEPGQGLTVRAVSPATGFVSFAASRGGVLLPVAAEAPASERALAFVDAYGSSFGLRDRFSVELRRGGVSRDRLGLEHVRVQQLHQGVPVRAGELIVHLRGARVMAVNGQIFDRLPAHVQPSYPSGAAEVEARAVVEKSRRGASIGMRLTAPRLEVFVPRVFGRGEGPARLAWFFEAAGPTLRELIWIDAHNGGLLLNFNQLAHAKTRHVYDANGSGVLPGTIARTEEQGPTGNVDVDRAFEYAGVTYDYFFNEHGRDSFDGEGGTLIATVGYCQPGAACPYGNAFWNGTQMVYGAGFASADDVVAHELTHAITERTADLFYYYQSGALNESYSDIFGEIVDLTSGAGGGNDAPSVRWKIGEDLPVGAVRDMMTPVWFGDPGKMSDAEFFCATDAWTNAFSDSGGVHTNSGVPNHAFALTVDGGAYNGQTIAGIGLAKAGRIYYRALTTYLTSGSTFQDNYLALNQACADLVGQHGITAGDCGESDKALRAVEMTAAWNCAGATATPDAMCPSGPVVSTFFSDDMETDSGNWSLNTGSVMQWIYLSSMLATSGTRSLYGIAVASASDHAAIMASPFIVPANGRFLFKHAFEFDSAGGSDWDGGVIEYSTDGVTWFDAAPFIEAGQRYNGQLTTDNPLGPRPAFTKASYGFTGTRLDLSSLAGQSIRIRFRVGTDNSIGSLGWVVDDVMVYACAAAIAPAFTEHPQNRTVAVGQAAQFTAVATGSPSPSFQWQRFVNGGTSWTNLTESAPYSGVQTSTLTIGAATAALNGVYYRVLAINAAASIASAPAMLTVQSPAGTAARPFDFDGDGRTDLSIFRPQNGQWWLQRSSTAVISATSFGLDGDVITPGDFTGDRKTDLAFYRPATGVWSVSTSEGTGTMTLSFGAPGDVPVPADYDGDGKTDVAVFRPAGATWFIRRSSDAGVTIQTFGTSTDVPAVGDYDGDGRADIAIFRPASGQWWIQRSTLGLWSLQFGLDGDRAVAGDYTGDGRTDVAVWRPSTGVWYVLRSEDMSFFAVGFGVASDAPIPGDYDGDGRIDIAVFRPSTGTWFIYGSTSGLQFPTFGLGTDKPVPSAFVRMY